MSPRKYEKRKRAESTEQTRGRILAASLELHSDVGSQATSWQDIADRAGVAVGTVYYHFPTIEDLVPACTTFAQTLVPPPTAQIFKGVRGTNKRIDVLVRSLGAYYVNAQGGMRNAFRERHRVGIVDAILTETERNLSTLVRELDPSFSNEIARKVEAVLDFRTWDSLQSRGLNGEVIAQTVSSLVRAVISKG